MAFSYMLVNIDDIYPSSFLALLVFPTKLPSSYMSNFILFFGDPREFN